MWRCEQQDFQDLTRPQSGSSVLQTWTAGFKEARWLIVQKRDVVWNVQHVERREMCVCINVCSYKAVTLAVKLASAGEEHGAGWHVDAHGESLGSK